MAFFLIVPSVIIVTIFLVHSAAERLGFKAKYSSLILCAIMALLVNFAAIEMSTYLDKWYYVKLGALVLAASVIVTLVNRYLIRHEKSDVIIIDDIDGELALEETKDEVIESVDISTAKSTNEKVVTLLKEDKSKSIADNDSEVEVEDKVTLPPKFLQREPDPKENTKSVESKLTDIKINVETVEVRGDDKVPKKVDEIQQTGTKSVVATIADNKKSENKLSTTLSVKSDEKLTKSIDEKEIKPTEDTKTKSIPIEKAENIQNKAQDKQPEKVEDKLFDINAHLGSLDDILDYAYAQKTNGDLTQAILAYQKALERYRSDDYAPFIAIDLGNIYKEQAAYSKVIKTYEEALKLPVVMRNADTRKEFNKNLSYMRIVQSVLIKHRALTMPFSKIPKQYLQEVETEFKSLQLNHSTIQKRY